jgi:hypothetical protein
VAGWRSETLKKHTDKLSRVLTASSLRRKTVVSFARKHQLIYFKSVPAENHDNPVVRGSSVAPDQVDTNYCVGSHAGYDIALVERLASASFEGHKTTVRRWYVLQIDLKHASNLPFVFLGTRQQSKAYYARILASHRDINYVSLPSLADGSAAFHASYALLASPAEFGWLQQLFTDEIMTTIAAYQHLFAVEIEGENLFVMTEALVPSEQLLDKLLHYGLWLAKEVDKLAT